MVKKWTPDELLELYQTHVGHKIQYYWNGTAENYAVVLRVKYCNALGYDVVKLWLDVKDANGFPLMIYDSNVKKCCCSNQ